ncbi:MAG: 2-dehydropantoate 2-reductase [Anaerolineales bacterium]|nr:2-dehydropantoate 2-reductase [Anaerolineales bacterium]
MKLTILGTGAVACLLGARLADRTDLTLLGSWPAGIDAIRRNGILCVTAGGSTTVHVRATADPADCVDSDLLIAVMKSYQTRAAVVRAKEILKPGGLALTLQNGLGNVEILREAFGAERAAGGIVVLGATLEAPGVVRQCGGEIRVQVEKHPRIGPAVELFAQAGLDVRIVENLASLQWGKLVINSALNPLGALIRVTNEVFAERDAAREVFLAVIRESAAVAAAAGIPLPYADPEAQALAAARATAGNSVSMRQDLENGRPTEIDAINGAVVRAAREAGIPAPWNRMLVQLIKAALTPDPSPSLSWERGASSAGPERNEGKREAG